MPTKEHQRLAEKSDSPVNPWRKWGPYIADRAWATVREDYSHDGKPFNMIRIGATYSCFMNSSTATRVKVSVRPIKLVGQR
jgi:hypothetical protein